MRTVQWKVSTQPVTVSAFVPLYQGVVRRDRPATIQREDALRESAFPDNEVEDTLRTNR